MLRLPGGPMELKSFATASSHFRLAHQRSRRGRQCQEAQVQAVVQRPVAVERVVKPPCVLEELAVGPPPAGPAVGSRPRA